MRRLNKKVLVILILITLILGIILIFATTKATEVASKILLVATVIDFIALTFLIQAFGFQSFKPKKMKYPPESVQAIKNTPELIAGSTFRWFNVSGIKIPARLATTKLHSIAKAII